MHLDDSSIVRIGFKEHAGIIESYPRQGLCSRIAQLDLCAICLIAIRTTINKML